MGVVPSPRFLRSLARFLGGQGGGSPPRAVYIICILVRPRRIMRRSKLPCSKVLLADVLSRKLFRQHSEDDRKVLTSKARSAPGQKDNKAVDQTKNTIRRAEE